MFISCLLDQLEIDRSFLSVLFTPIITIFLILWTWSWDTKLNTLDTNEQDDIINQWEWWISCYGMVNLNIMGHLNVAWKRGIHCTMGEIGLLNVTQKYFITFFCFCTTFKFNYLLCVYSYWRINYIFVMATNLTLMQQFLTLFNPILAKVTIVRP